MQDHSAPASREADDSPRGSQIAGIISEFSEIFASARTRWVRYAEEVHPDLKGGGMMVLQTVLRKGPVTATGISQLLGMDKAMVSRHISKLRELGFVETEPAPEDRRVILLTISERASELMERIRERWADSYHQRFEEWSIEDLERLREGLHRFNTSTEDASHADGPAMRCSRGHGGGASGGAGSSAG